MMRPGAPEDCTNLKNHGCAPFFTDNLSNCHLPNLPIVQNEYHRPHLTSETQSSASTYNVFADDTRAKFLPISETFDSDFARTRLPDLKSLHKNKSKRRSSTILEKPAEVIHVRAKRGQATDSHSLAERVRREKINEKLRCLQDLVPGCYKTMGMAVMLGVIIDYIQSLQHQIEFLSSKLSEASMNLSQHI